MRVQAARPGGPGRSGQGREGQDVQGRRSDESESRHEVPPGMFGTALRMPSGVRREGSRQAIWQQQRRANEDCTICNEPVDEVNPRTGFKYARCMACRVKATTRRNERYADRSAAGFCPRCGSAHTDPPWILCRKCRASKALTNAQADRRQWCRDCGRKLLTRDNPRCRTHAIRHAEAERGRRARLRDGVAAVPVSGVPQSVAGAV